MNRLLRPVLGLVAGALLAGPVFAQQTVKLDIVSQPLAEALRKLGSASNTNIMFEPAMVNGIVAPAVKGEVTAKEALTRLLAGTKWTFKFVDANTVSLVPVEMDKTKTSMAEPEQALQVAQAGEVVQKEAPTSTLSDSDAAHDDAGSAIPEILVSGSRTLNMDIRRSPDAAQPYVVFNRETIERSGMTNLGDFLKNRLTMSTGATSPGQQNSGLNTSKINLRGLGADETLVLIDGRRAATFGTRGGGQPDINSIPISAVERIEVLPTTASGIYGGGATGGVVNIVMRRDYSGVETRVTYANTFDTDAAMRRVDLSSGFNLEEGRTNILFAASWSDANQLLTRDRDAGDRLRAHLLGTIGYAGLEASGQVPWGATTNIRSTTGTPLTLKGSNLALNATRTYVPYGYAGPASDGGLGLTTFAGSYNFDLIDSAQGNAAAGGGRVALANSPTVQTLSATIRREFSPRVSAFLEFGNSLNAGVFERAQAINTITLAGGAAANPFNQQITISTPNFDRRTAEASVRSLRAVGGVIVKLPWDWSMSLDHTWNRTRDWSSSVPTVNNPAVVADVSSGALNVFRDTTGDSAGFSSYFLDPSVTTPGNNVLKDTTLRLSGPMPFSVPGGAPTLTTLLEYREENIGTRYNRLTRAATATTVNISRTFYPDLAQQVSSVYMEALLPFVSSRNVIPGIQLLELQLAGRYDEYKTDGASSVDADANGVPLTPVVRARNEIHSADPTLALRYQPVDDLTVRASYGTGFLPPSVSQLVQSAPLALPNFAGLTDPLRNNELVGNYLLYQGGNADLMPEESESWSAGMILTPRMAPGLRISVDWMKIRKENNIATISAFTSQALFNALLATAPERIRRDPPTGGAQYGPVVGIDTSLVNIATLNVKALDFAVDYQFGENRFGDFDLHVGATKLLSLQTQLAAGQPMEELVGVGPAASVGAVDESGGLKWKANATLNWRHGDWSLGWTARFFDSYFLNSAHTIDARQGAATIPNQIYHDLFGGYTFRANTEIQFVVNNVFNKEPPLDVVAIGTESSGYSTYGDPRLANYSLSIRKSF